MRAPVAVVVVVSALSIHCGPSGAPAAVAPAVVDEPESRPRGPGGSIVWELATELPIGVDGDRVLVWDRARGGLAEHAAADGAHVRTRPIAGLPAGGTIGWWERAPGGYLALGDAAGAGRAMYVRERGDALAVAWTVPDDERVLGHEVLDDAIAFGVAGAQPAVVTRALADGRVRWRAKLPPHVRELRVSRDRAAGVVYALWSERDPDAPWPPPPPVQRVRALDAATGATRWTLALDVRPEAIDVARGTVVAAYPEAIHFLDGASGAIRAEIPLLEPMDVQLRLDGDQAFVAVDRGVAAFELATGALQWRAPATLMVPTLHVSGDEVIVTTPIHTALAFARDTGERRWHVGLGARPLRVEASRDALIAFGRAGLTGFALPPIMPEETARIRGRVVAGTCGALARPQAIVAGASVPVAADGTYATEVTARGLVAIEVLDDNSLRGSIDSATAAVRLDGRGEYVVPDLAPPCE